MAEPLYQAQHTQALELENVIPIQPDSIVSSNVYVPPTLWYRMYHSFDESPSIQDQNGETIDPLKKELQGYHSQLIALGSSIGTGLFVGSGRGLAVAGPLPLLAAFAFVGLALCPTIFALGEMATLISVPGGFFEHCRMYTDEAWGGAMGWNYVFQWIVTLPLELVAATIVLQTWGEPVPQPFIWVLIFIVALTVINIFGVKGYGNVEATLSIVKVGAIIGFIIFGILYDLGLGSRRWEPIGVKYWYDPGATRNGFYGFCSVLVTAAFAYSGSEVVGLTAYEQAEPKRDMPRAIKQVFWRIGIFYLSSIFLIGLLIPYNNEYLIQDTGSLNSAKSPFIIVIEEAGIKILPHIVNAVVVVTILSVANSSIYASSRVLNAMAVKDLAPKWFAYVDIMGRPIHCLVLSFTLACLAFLVQLKDEQSAVFLWLLSICGLSSVICWASICYTHIQFRAALKLKGKALSTLPYESPLGVLGSYIGLLLNIFIILCQLVAGIHPVDSELADMSAGQRAAHFWQSFMALPLIFLVFAWFKWYKGTRIIGMTMSLNPFSNAKIERGRGTAKVDLNQVDFSESWNDGSYILHALNHPNDVIRVERLWWCPRFIRPAILFFDFPWRLPSEKQLVTEDTCEIKRKAAEDKDKRDRVMYEEIRRGVLHRERPAIDQEIEDRVAEILEENRMRYRGRNYQNEH